MHSIKHILVPTDHSTCAQAALLHAFHLAQRYKSEIHLLHIVELSEEERSQSRYYPEDNTHESDAEKYKEQDSNESWNDVHIRRVTRLSSDATQGILAYSREQQIDLIIMGAHGDSGADRFLICGLDYLLIGTTAEQIVQSATCPVLTVGLRRGRYPSLVKHILLPVDLESPDTQAVVRARELASIYEAHLSLLHVIEAQGDGLMRNTPEAWDSNRVWAEERLREIYESAGGPDVTVGIYVVPGRLSREISAFAESHDVQLIVLSSHGLTSVEHRPLQDENEQIAQMASFSVYTTRASEVVAPEILKAVKAGSVHRNIPAPELMPVSVSLSTGRAPGFSIL